jgi:hypothetical protein
MDQTFYAWNYDPYAFRTTLGAKVGIYRGYNRSACDRPGESRVVRWEPGRYSVERGSAEDRIPPDEKDTGGWLEVETDYSVPEDPPPRWDLTERERGLWTDQSIYFDNIYFNYH